MRGVTTDLFAITLAQAVAYSIFDTSLMAPYSWISGIGEMAFGDEETRKRAFYGTYGLSEIMPPVARIPFHAIKNMLWLDIGELANYQMWTWFPFGRFTRDIYRTANRIDMSVDYLTGIPMNKTYWWLSRTRKEDTIPHALK